MSNGGLTSTVRSVVSLGREREVSFMAGSIAFFAFLSLIPALMLVFAIGSLIGGEQFANQIISLIETHLSEQGTSLIDDALGDPSRLVAASIVGAVALLWSAFKVFRAIDIAFDRIYELEVPTSLPRQLLNAAIVTVAISAGFALLVAVQLLVSQLPDVSPLSSRLLQIPLLIAGLVIVLAPLYYIMPPMSIRAREVIPGTIVAVVGLLVLQQVFQIYAANAGQYQAYGYVGAVLLFLLWLYFGSIALLLGAVVNAAVGDRSTTPGAARPAERDRDRETSADDRRRTRERAERERRDTREDRREGDEDRRDEDEEPTRIT